MLFFQTDASGLITACGDSNLLPEGAVEIGHPLRDRFVAAGMRARLVNGEVVPLPEEPVAPAVPASISDRQFAQVLALDGLITEAEAIAWVSQGEIPAQLVAALETIKDSQERFAAQMILAGATEFRRDHPFTAFFASVIGKTAAEVDDIWTRAAAL